MHRRVGILTQVVWGVGILAVGCGGPARTGAKPAAGPVEPPPPPVRALGGHERLIGLMCPRGAAGRPAFAALTAREALAWTSDPERLKKSLARGRTAELLVLGFDGKRAGWFTPAGVAATELAPATAVGAYAGSLPCADEATATECQAVTGSCGVAVGSPEAEDPTPGRESGACVARGVLVLDVDGDGRREAFRVADLATLPEEATGRPATAEERCSPRFAFAVGHDFDVIGVADLDGDGRVEVIVSRRGDKARKVSIYSADTAFRLNRVGSAEIH